VPLQLPEEWLYIRYAVDYVGAKHRVGRPYRSMLPRFLAQHNS